MNWKEVVFWGVVVVASAFCITQIASCERHGRVENTKRHIAEVEALGRALPRTSTARYNSD